jgi:hypothetical protein
MLAAIATIVGLHSLYWFSGGPDIGARYWYLVLVPCIALAARGVEWLESRAPRAPAGIALLALASLATFVPWRAADKYRHYRGMRPGVRELAAARDFGRSLVLVQGKRFPDYASAIVYNPADVRDPDAPVFVWDRNADARAAALRAYRDRPVWVIQGPAITGDDYRVVAGPLRAAEVDARVGAADGRFDRTGSNTRGIVPPGAAEDDGGER